MESDALMHPVTKDRYAHQVGLKDLDFDVNEDRLKELSLSFPFQSTGHAEQALLYGAIRPTGFSEDDGSEHALLSFDPRPIGFSGFMGCATHSLALTDRGLFEVGRYAAFSGLYDDRQWQWFLHRRLFAPDEALGYCKAHHMTSQQLMEEVYQALTAG